MEGYPNGWKSYRALQNNGPKLRGDIYFIDCVGFVSLCIFRATGLTNSAAMSGEGGYMTPRMRFNKSTHDGQFDVLKISSTSELRSGDVIISSGHVAVFVREADRNRICN